MAEAVGGVVYVFDQKERAEKLRAVVSSLGPTDSHDLRRTKLDAVMKEVSSVRPQSGPASGVGRTLPVRTPAGVSAKIPPPRRYLQHR